MLNKKIHQLINELLILRKRNILLNSIYNIAFYEMFRWNIQQYWFVIEQ